LSEWPRRAAGASGVDQAVRDEYHKDDEPKHTMLNGTNFNEYAIQQTFKVNQIEEKYHSNPN
jgi:hypothetical protein